MSFDMWTCQEGPIFPKWKQPAKKETFLWTGPLKFCGAYVLHSFLDGWFMLITYPGPTFNLYKLIPFPSPSLKTSTDGLVAVPQRMPQAKQSTTWQHKDRRIKWLLYGSLLGGSLKLLRANRTAGNQWMNDGWWVDGWTVLSVFVCKKKW